MISERTQAYPEQVVEYGVGTWNVGVPKNNFTYLQGHYISTTHAETFLDGCLNDLAKINRSRKIEEKEKVKHARLPAQVPKSREPKKPGGNNRQERKGVHPHLAENHSA